MKAHILVVEDSDEDYLSLQRAFNQCNVQQGVLRFTDGMEAAQHLASLEDMQDSMRYPILILLDLNLPDIDGRAFLEWIKQRPVLRKIPVLILTSSGNMKDIDDCYIKGANSYIQKPQQFNDFLKIVQHLKQYWLEVSTLPLSC